MADLNFDQSVELAAATALFDAFFTAVLVAGAAVIVVNCLQNRADRSRRAEEGRRARAAAALEARQLDDQRKLAEEHDLRQQDIQLAYQTRSALRESYVRLLVVQRRSRELSIRRSDFPANAVDAATREATTAAIDAYDDFVNEYHRLALDADAEMWPHLRRLEATLKEMLAKAQEGDARTCRSLGREAAHARRQLEDTFRVHLGHAELHYPTATKAR
jgi:hypothetical protein